MSDQEKTSKTAMARINRDDDWGPPPKPAPVDKSQAVAAVIAKIESALPDLPFDLTDIDLKRPPGFAGALTAYLNAQCLYPRHTLAAVTALLIIGNAGGLRHRDVFGRATANLYLFCIAASGTGKNDLMVTFRALHELIGFDRAISSDFKSTQELVRKLIEHQPCCLSIDEAGITFKKVKNAEKRGTASYLEDLVAKLLTLYSAAASSFGITGDLGRSIEAEYVKKVAVESKALEDGKGSERRLASYQRMLANAAQRKLVRPFVSMIGFTTKTTFEDLIDAENASSGFLGRFLIVEEHDVHPDIVDDFFPAPPPDNIGGTLSQIYLGGSFNQQDQYGRIEFYGEQHPVETDDDAKIALKASYDYFYRLAAVYVELGQLPLVAIVRRAHELVVKVSFILAIGDQSNRTVEHVRWAFALARRDTYNKSMQVFAVSGVVSDPERAFQAKVRGYLPPLGNLSKTGKQNGITFQSLQTQMKVKKADAHILQKALESLKAVGEVNTVEGRKSGGKPTIQWFKIE